MLRHWRSAGHKQLLRGGGGGGSHVTNHYHYTIYHGTPPTSTQPEININLGDNKGRTPLYEAASSGHVDVVKQEAVDQEEDGDSMTDFERGLVSGVEGCYQIDPNLYREVTQDFIGALQYDVGEICIIFLI